LSNPLEPHNAAERRSEGLALIKGEKRIKEETSDSDNFILAMNCARRQTNDYSRKSDDNVDRRRGTSRGGRSTRRYSSLKLDSSVDPTKLQDTNV
jgi:hypothetical protein